MGKHFWMKHVYDDKSHDKQPGCMWGLVHALNYRHWQSNVRKMIQHRKYEGQTHPKCDWSPKTKIYSHDDDDYEEEKLLDEKESTPHLSTKRSRKKRSLKAHIKALIAEEISKESENPRGKAGFSFGSNLQRTYSIHHLESLDDDKIHKNWKHPIILLPRDVENSASHQSQDINDQMKAAGIEEAAKQDPDVLEIFKVDKQLLIKHLQNADEGVVNFTRSALGLNKKAKFSKSRSFPVAEFSQRKKLKPVKLENKQKEVVWPFPREEKVQTSESCRENADRKAEKNDSRKLAHGRSSSLNESLDKYARLFENSFGTDAKLNTSKSLKLTTEYGPPPVYFRRVRTLSNVDSYCFDSNFEVLGDDDKSGKCHEEPVDGCDSVQIKEDGDCEKVDGFKEEADKLKESDSLYEQESDCPDIAHRELSDHGLILASEIHLGGTESPKVELEISEGLEHGSSIVDLNSPLDSKDSKSLPINSLPTHNTLNLDNNEISDKITKHCFARDECPKKTNSDMYYVRNLLNQSGIAKDASEIVWHASDQPLGPQLFEEVEACWPHDQDQLNGYPHFYGCWHHQMLFDLVNEVLLEVYDVSLPYYPKSLSSSCHVRPFPWGNHVIDEITKSTGTLMTLEPEEKQSMESIMAHDLSPDNRWMNLQFDTECIALDLEDVIFNEILEEVIFS